MVTTAKPRPPVLTGCAEALAYLAQHAAPGFVSYCQPGLVCLQNGCNYSTTCVSGTHISCPHGGAQEIIIGLSGTCRITYLNEAANSYHFNLTTREFLGPLDPYGEYCPGV